MCRRYSGGRSGPTLGPLGFDRSGVQALGRQLASVMRCNPYGCAGRAEGDVRTTAGRARVKVVAHHAMSKHPRAERRGRSEIIVRFSTGKTTSALKWATCP